ncbi:hypothetical protein H6P81_014074 [Aristolochia fimbriata]|uniref:Embryonic stem cell-specific 5-hydroxymethylcytosine-binding protein n=1 Tax=Aristolochia fimbriata TaxID=158543 RepID=A0AAV7EJT9_ARIFI|nr:hypothetical protein H6P81_014074 [Aristolochia fimbriata]
MCGRARCTLRPDDVPRACGFQNSSVTTLQTDRYRPSYNVSPGRYLPVLRRDEGEAGVCVHCMKWGLISSFTKKTEKPDHFRMFNARSESIGEKASFRRLIPKRRCLLAVEGFYEWKKEGSKRQPYYIYFKDQRPLVFAALYDSWTNSEGEVLYTFTILTTRCSSALEWLHDRMPIILGSENSSDLWLNESSTTKVNDLLVPYEGSDLVWYPVTPDMGKTAFDGPECIKEIKLKTEGTTSISNFFSKKTTDTKHIVEPKHEKISDESTVSVVGFTCSGDCGGNSMKADTPTDDIRSVKEENLEEDTKGKDINVDATKTSTKGEERYGIKRDHELYATGLKPLTHQTIETKSNSKKGRTKNDAGKGVKGQPTLHSYFGTK